MARPIKEKQYLYDKRSEMIWILDDFGYDGVDIAIIFNVDKSQISRAMDKKPKGWKLDWLNVSKGRI